jgi:4-hydroxybenzoate polyprenyltransferase
MNFSTSQLRTLLVLGRVSNLPTVWTNCLAGWWLGGGKNYWSLPCLLLGVSALYIGGMYLNDACDLEFDRQRRPERPIPSGKIALCLVWRIGFGLLIFGVLDCYLWDFVAGVVALLLAGSILIYNLTHKVLMASPWLMGGCRFWVYILAGTMGARGLNGYTIFCGAALAFYIVGLSYVAKRETFHASVPYWSAVLLTVPIGLALVMNDGEFRVKAEWISAVLLLWLVRSVHTIFWSSEIMAGRIVANLLAGIVFVDWLAVAPDSPKWFGFIFLAMLGLTKWLQKFVPAT